MRLVSKEEWEQEQARHMRRLGWVFAGLAAGALGCLIASYFFMSFPSGVPGVNMQLSHAGTLLVAFTESISLAGVCLAAAVFLWWRKW